MDLDEPAAPPVLPIYQRLLEEVDPATREAVIAMSGTQQDSHRPAATDRTPASDSQGRGRHTTRR